MDVAHVTWMIKKALITSKKEKIDSTILLPLVILHDVGYGVSKHVYFDKKLKKRHMAEGARISEEILNKVNYPKDKIKQIKYFISVHDNWILGDEKIYKKYKVLGIFNDLDFVWIVTSKGFGMVSDILRKNKKRYILELIKEGNEKYFSSRSTKKLFEDYASKTKRLVLKT